MIKVKCKYIFTEGRLCDCFDVKLRIYLDNRIFPIRLNKTILSTWWDEYSGEENYSKFLNNTNTYLNNDNMRRRFVRAVVKKELKNRDINVKNTNLKSSVLAKIKSINSEKCEEYIFQYEDLMDDRK